MKRNIIKTVLFLIVMLAAGQDCAFCEDSSCIPISDDLNIEMCVQYKSDVYHFTLTRVSGTSGFTWKMDPSTLRSLDQPNDPCCYMGDDFAIRLSCGSYQNYDCAFTLTYAPDPQDPSGWYWKMDPASLVLTSKAVADPLFPFQWHLSNSAQTAFARNGGKPGEDLRMTQAIAEKLTGRGVIVAVVDSGLEIAHEDIAANVIPDGSYNYINNTTDPTSFRTDGDHGTCVSGIIAAVALNGKGGRGVAPQASLKAFNALETKADQDIIESLGGHPRSQDVDVFNMSYGVSSTGYVSLSTTEKELYASSGSLRGGKGGIYVTSAGNGFDDFRVSRQASYDCSDEVYSESNLTCQNAVGQEEKSRPEVIVVGAFNAAGDKSSYSTAGSNLWISAPGGEYGYRYPAIITIDQTGCDKGISRSDLPSPVNRFETGDTTYNADCNYTSRFNGTSSAAPNASGAIALLLETNPDLTRRDVKHILAKTARKIDPDSSGSLVTVDINGVDYVASDGWIENSAGYHFHNYYGFGALDVDAAVAEAKKYQAGRLPALQDRSYGVGALAEPVAIPDNTASGISRAIDVPDDLTIENLFVMVSIDHPDTAEVGIEITSPNGTKSILLNIRSGLKTGLKRDEGALLASNAFYGEKSKGTWRLRVLDSWPHNEGTLNYCKLRILGY